jgi:hypothetical protein
MAECAPELICTLQTKEKYSVSTKHQANSLVVHAEILADENFNTAFQSAVL